MKKETRETLLQLANDIKTMDVPFSQSGAFTSKVRAVLEIIINELCEVSHNVDKLNGDLTSSMVPRLR